MKVLFAPILANGSVVKFVIRRSREGESSGTGLGWFLNRRSAFHLRNNDTQTRVLTFARSWICVSRYDWFSWQEMKMLKDLFYKFFTLNLTFYRFYIKTERVTLVLTWVKTFHKKMFIFTKSTEKTMFSLLIKLSLFQSKGPYISTFAFTKFWSHLTFCSIELIYPLASS